MGRRDGLPGGDLPRLDEVLKGKKLPGESKAVQDGVRSQALYNATYHRDIVRMDQEAQMRAMHEYFLPLGPGKYFDEFSYGTVIGPAVAQAVADIRLTQGEAAIIAAIGTLQTVGAAAAIVTELAVNDKGVVGYSRLIGPLCDTSLDFSHLAPLWNFVTAGSRITLTITNIGGAAVTISSRVRGRILTGVVGPAF
jgi:hypothetical protein